MIINKIHHKGIKIIVLIILSLIIASSSVYALTSADTNEASKNTAAALNSPGTISKGDDAQSSSSENDVTYDEWKASMESENKLPREQELALYNQGYDFSDIQEAEDLAVLCGKTPQDLLALKGKRTYSTDGGSIKDISKPWSDVIKELNITMEAPTQAMGITSDQISDMKQQGLSDADIEQVAVLAFNYHKNYKEILSAIAQGTSVEDLKKQYWQTRHDEAQKQDVSKDKARANTERLLRKQYNITDDDIKTCGTYGINDIVEIALAKDVAIKNNIGLSKVLQLKKTKNNWNDVRNEAGGK